MELLKFFIVSREVNNIGVGVCELRQGIHYDLIGKKKDAYKDGKRNGRSTWWYENGHPSGDDHYVNGHLHGLRRYWYENGHLWYEQNYNKKNPQFITVNGEKMCIYELN